jgi:hypothetical protein
MKQSGIDDADIPSFADPENWLKYFPPLAKRDVTAMGCQAGPEGHTAYRKTFTLSSSSSSAPTFRNRTACAQ